MVLNTCCIETDFHRELKRVFIDSEYVNVPREEWYKLMNRYAVRNCVLPHDVGVKDWYSWRNNDNIHVPDDTGVFIYGITSVGNYEDVCIRIDKYNGCMVFSTYNNCMSKMSMPIYIHANEKCKVELVYPDRDALYGHVCFAIVGFVVEIKGRMVAYADTNI